MLPTARGLSFRLRGGPRPSGSLFTSRLPLISRSPSTLNAFRQFSSTRVQNAKYVRFEVDPEQPLKYRRWSTGTQVVGGTVVLAVAYYVSQYVPTFARALKCPATFLHVCSLETVPETGRWRFMDVSPKFETRVHLNYKRNIYNTTDNDRQMAKELHEQLLQEFRGKVLPPNHPLTQAVRGVVTRILEASNLGSLKTEPNFIQQAGMAIEDLWHADVQSMEEPVPGSGSREWRLMVVDDPKVVNAMAGFGQRLTTYLPGNLAPELTERLYRQYCCLHWYHSSCKGRGWSCRYSWTRFVPPGSARLGAVLIHGTEIAHVVARHNAERYSSMKVLIGFATLLEVLGLDVGIARLLTTFLLDLPNSRKQELEGLRIHQVVAFEVNRSFSRCHWAETVGKGLL